MKMYTKVQFNGWSYGYESYIVGKVLNRAIFRCIKNFGDVSGFSVIVFFLFLARLGRVRVLV